MVLYQLYLQIKTHKKEKNMKKGKIKGGSTIPHLWNGIPGIEIDNPSNNSVVSKGITCKVNEATSGISKKY